MSSFKNVATKFALFALVATFITACGETSPRDLRAEFEEKLEKNLKIMLPLMSDRKLPKGIEKCMAKAASDTFSDADIKLAMDSSLSDKLNNADRIMDIQQRLESPQFMLAFLNRCAK